MKESSAYRAIRSLEQVTAARLRASQTRVVKLARQRYILIAENARVRQALLAQPRCTGFECAALCAYTALTAAAAASLVSAKLNELLGSAKLSQERLHWARCRRGLERRMKHGAIN